MDFLLEIAIDYFEWILGKKSQDTLSKGNKRKAYILLSIFLVPVIAMVVYSLTWILGLLK